MPKATNEVGTELLTDSETLAPTGTWSDVANASDVFRQGALVTLAIRVKPKARAAWEKKTYKKGELAEEGGHVYEAKVAETDENKPSTKAAQWTDLGTAASQKVITTLPEIYRPAATTKDATTATVEVKENGEVVALDALTESTERVYKIQYRAAKPIP